MSILQSLKTYPRVLTIAGSDSGGGAGVQADLKTIFAFGCYGASVITAITSQNTVGVFNVHEIPENHVSSQLDCVFTDIGFNAVKVGMLSSQKISEIVVEKLLQYRCENVVLDPVMLSKSNFILLKNDAIQFMLTQLFPLAKVVTPNIPEAEIFLSRKIATRTEIENAASELLSFGSIAVILKGGHSIDATKSSDCLAMKINDTTVISWLDGKRVYTKNTHGTGCTFSSAIASGLANGFGIEAAFQHAKDYISRAILMGSEYQLGNGFGPVCHFISDVK